MSLRQSLRRLFQRSSHNSTSRANSNRRRHNRFERLEGRAMLTSVSGDFNGDGFDDLAVGSPLDNFGGKADAGSVQILFGTTSGLASTGNRRFTLDSPGVNGVAAGGEHFGAALAAGDFDGDGFDDLAIGAPGERVDGLDAGAVHILYGSRSGLRAKDDQRFHQNSPGVNGVAADGDLFGSALAAGDFDHNGRDDLAIGVPGQDVVGKNNAGAVNILYGRKSGLRASGDQLWSQNSTGVNGNPAVDDQFGFSLAEGDFNGDARRDLAIGIIGKRIDGNANAGAVYIMYGRSSGLGVSGDQYRHLGQANIEGRVTADGEFGYALAAGDFNDDSRDDLAVGSPGEDIRPEGGVTAQLSGAVHVFMGGRNGTLITGNQIWNKGSDGIQEVPSDDDRFGAALTVGQINRNRQDDLIIGIPGNTISGNAGAGSIRVLFGSASGLTATSTVSMNQSSGSDIGTLVANDNFGSALAIGDYNGDQLMDVAVGVPGDQTTGGIKSGGVDVFYANANTLGTSGAQLWLPGEDGLKGTANEDDQFGAALG